ncbi:MULTISPECIES: TRAP transporter small permease [Prauserella salsuginis group]|uniref:TRAP transporter small permease n=1 Tax=Prauserella salsuginis TaxID=387889 RepID=A0ABW6G163_9PSEU|nr:MULTISPECIES: TRAP transporter small permease [Prauserella salsuginis group]MCR3722046.1 TRAP-type C4-dicarboxylate transport system, small permease component [Prauserella flava]MCR3732627.1 TRAP-type C4-dicarboxylate transport system, small permease component [Prauserella salsuginis]
MAEQDGTAARSRPGPLRWLSTMESVVGGLLLTTIMVLMLGQALQRYLPTGGWVGSGELARFSLVWMTFAMAGYLMERDAHVTLKVIDTVTRGLTRRLVFVFANIMVAIVCLNLAYEAFVLVTDESSQVSPALGLPIRWFYVIPLVGLLLTALRSVVAVFLPPPAVGEESQA